MKTFIPSLIRQAKNVPVIVVALLIGGTVGGWGTSMMLAASSSAVEGQPPFEVVFKGDMTKRSPDAITPGLIGSYAVTGTDAEGKPYVGAGIVDIALAPSGALELEWDNGKQVGVAHIVGNVLAIACLTKGRTVILTMNINPNGSLSGKWSRRTDRGYRGTEMWTKAS
jgi:hypothetical protein